MNVTVAFKDKHIEISKNFLMKEFAVLKLYFEDTEQKDLFVSSKKEYNFWKYIKKYSNDINIKVNIESQSIIKEINASYFYFLEKYESLNILPKAKAMLEKINLKSSYTILDVIELLKTYEHFKDRDIFSHKTLFILWHIAVLYEMRISEKKELSFLEDLRKMRTYIVFHIISIYYEYVIPYENIEGVDKDFVQSIFKAMKDSGDINILEYRKKLINSKIDMSAFLLYIHFIPKQI